MNISSITEVIAAQKRGDARGITSICSANTFVLDAAFTHAGANELPLLIESTCNQVNQYGGYTGQTPSDFMHCLQAIGGPASISFEPSYRWRRSSGPKSVAQ